MAPKAVSAADRNKAINEVRLRLKKAGVDLFKFQTKYGTTFSDPQGFEFTCPNYHQLVQDAETSDYLAWDVVDLPGKDPWKESLITSVGYTEIDVNSPVHLDVAVDNSGRCRAYIMPASVKMKADMMRQGQITTANDSPVYSQIAKRLRECNPPIELDDHVAKIMSIADNTLDGVNFKARDYKALIDALMDAKDGAGNPVFAHATLKDPDHWALKASFLATDGTGFREVFRMRLNTQRFGDEGTVDGYTNKRMRRFSGQFQPSTNVPDLSSLHCAVSIAGCNIHIDETGFVVADDKGNPILDADFLQHLVNELLFKTYAKKILPAGFVDRVSLNLPSTANDFNFVGASFDFYRGKKIRVTLTAGCSVFGPQECSATLSVGGRF